MYSSKWLDRGPCPKCGSSDAKVKHAEGYSYCFSCETRFGEDEDMNNVTPMPVAEAKPLTKEGIVADIIERKITKDTAEKYNTKITRDGTVTTKHIYEYFDVNGSHVANKLRNTSTKQMWTEGSIQEAMLFGQNLFSSGGKYVTITEGEVDAMSAYQLMGSKWASVSIKTGACGALRDCKASFEYLDSFENIIICFDMDEQGRKAANKVAQLFSPNKCKIMSMEYKDANEYLKMGKSQAFNQAWWSAQPYTPAGIMNLQQLGSSLFTEEYCETCLFPWSKMNDKTYGMRTGELITFTSGAGMGKSSIMRELMHHLFKNTKDNIGILALEESVKNTAFNIMSVEADARLYIKEIRKNYTQDQLDKWQEDTIGSGRFFAFDHFGSISNDEILARVRYMAQALDCKWIFIDHLSILVSGQEEGDERKSIDVLMTKLRSLVEQTGVGMLLVSHLRRPAGDSGHENGKEITLSHLRGSASIAHLSDSVIGLERNQQAEGDEANTTTIRILKNRYTGETGIATHLYYNRDTGRLTEVDNPYEAEYNVENKEEVPF